MLPNLDYRAWKTAFLLPNLHYRGGGETAFLVPRPAGRMNTAKMGPKMSVFDEYRHFCCPT